MRYIDQGKPPQVAPELLRSLTEHAARCIDCAAGKPASTSGGHVLHAQISDDQEEFLRAFADARGLSVSAAVRLIIHDRAASEAAKR